MAYEPTERHLEWAAWAFAFGSGIHLFDHLRRGQDSVTEQLYWAGNLALVLQVVVITLAVTRHRMAATVAAAAGALAVGVTGWAIVRRRAAAMASSSTA